MNEEIKERLEQIRRGEIPNGYRRTKKGIVPENWSDCRIETFCNMKSGNGITSASIYPTGAFPCYGGNGLRGYTDTFTHSGRYVLIGRVGALCGNVLLADGQFFASEHAIVTECNQHALTEFCYYLFNYMNLNRYSEASAQPVLAVQKLLKLTALLPPLAEQRRIAEILSAQDSVIELKERLIAEKQRQKKYLMQRLLTGKQRLSGFSGEWKTIQIGDNKYTRIDPEYLSANTSANYKFTYITLESVDNGRLVNTLQCEYATAPSRARKIIRYMDVLFGMVRPNLHSHLFVDNNDGDICSTGFCVIRCNQNKVNPKLLYYHLFSTHMDKQIDSAMVGSNYPAVSANDVKHLKVTIPVNISEQAAIADILSAADREIELLRASLEQEKRKKKALSQLLLTGIVRV